MQYVFYRFSAANSNYPCIVLVFASTMQQILSSSLNKMNVFSSTLLFAKKYCDAIILLFLLSNYIFKFYRNSRSNARGIT
jgi:hypothetical protein